MRLTASALGAAVVLELLVNGEPDGVVRVGRIAGAADMALGGLGTMRSRIGLARTTHERVNFNWVLEGAHTGHLEGVHVEYINALHLSEQLEPL